MYLIFSQIQQTDCKYTISKPMYQYRKIYLYKPSIQTACLSVCLVCQSVGLSVCESVTWGRVFCDSLVTPYSKLDFRVLNHHQFKTDAVLGHVTLDLNALLHKHDGKCKCLRCFLTKAGYSFQRFKIESWFHIVGTAAEKANLPILSLVIGTLFLKQSMGPRDIRECTD